MSEPDFDPKMRILIVDDSSTMRRIIGTALKDIGLRNYTMAEDGDEAWEMIQNEHFDLILSDHKMERVSGEELLRLVRENEMYQNMPFIMITAESFRENVVKAVQLGVSNYIVKPFSTEQLRDKIAKVCCSTC